MNTDSVAADFLVHPVRPTHVGIVLLDNRRLGHLYFFLGCIRPTLCLVHWLNTVHVGCDGDRTIVMPADDDDFSVVDPGGVQTPALLFRCLFLKRTYFENMLLRFLAEQGAS